MAISSDMSSIDCVSWFRKELAPKVNLKVEKILIDIEYYPYVFCVRNQVTKGNNGSAIGCWFSKLSHVIEAFGDAGWEHNKLEEEMDIKILKVTDMDSIFDFFYDWSRTEKRSSIKGADKYKLKYVPFNNRKITDFYNNNNNTCIVRDANKQKL